MWGQLIAGLRANLIHREMATFAEAQVSTAKAPQR